MIAGSPVCNDANLLCVTSAIDIQQVPGPFWQSPLVNDIPSRPLYRSGSPSTTQSIKLHKLAHGPGASPSQPMFEYAQSGQRIDGSLEYHANSAHNTNILNTFAPTNASEPSTEPSTGSLLTDATLLSMGTTQMPCQDRSRVSLMMPPPEESTLLLHSRFPEEQNIPAFQQLVNLDFLSKTFIF